MSRFSSQVTIPAKIHTFQSDPLLESEFNNLYNNLWLMAEDLQGQVSSIRVVKDDAPAPPEYQLPKGEVGSLLIGQGINTPTVIKELSGSLALTKDGVSSLEPQVETRKPIRSLETTYTASSFLFVNIAVRDNKTGAPSTEFELWINDAGEGLNFTDGLNNNYRIAYWQGIADYKPRGNLIGFIPKGARYFVRVIGNGELLNWTEQRIY